MDFENLARVHLRKGAGGQDGGVGGGDPASGLCVMELVSWIASEERVTDEPACACPVLTAFAIALNDAAPEGERDSLKPIALKLVGSRDRSQERRRVAFILRETAHLLSDLIDGHLPAAARLSSARTPAAIRRAALAAQDALSNARRSSEWANARAGLGRLAEAARTKDRAFDLALRDAVFCTLNAGDAPDWRRARAILLAAIDLGAHGAIEAPPLRTPIRARDFAAA